MKDKAKGVLIAAAAIAAAAVGGAAIAGATGGGGGDDNATEQPITGSALDKASAIALKETGGGKVSASEIRDQEGYYEIEVTRDDGSQVDVHLDRGFNVIDSSADGNGSSDEGPNNN